MWHEAIPGLAFVFHYLTVAGLAVVFARFVRKPTIAVVLAVSLGVVASLVWCKFTQGHWGVFVFSPDFTPTIIGHLDGEYLMGLVETWILPSVLAYVAIGLTRRIRVRIPRYSLRTLLLVVTAFSVVMSLAAVRVDVYRNERHATRVIEDQGGTVWWGGTHATAVYLCGTRVTPAVFENLTVFSHLGILSLDRTNVTDADLAHLRVFSRLETVRVAGTRVTDTGIRHLEGIRSIEYVDVSNTEVSEAGIQRLRRALPNARIVDRAREQR